MSITFPSELKKPSGIVDGLPNALVRPAFEKLYGFDVPTDATPVIDGAIFTEGGEPMTTEANDIILFE
jgi:hypothetical protein